MVIFEWRMTQMKKHHESTSGVQYYSLESIIIGTELYTAILNLNG